MLRLLPWVLLMILIVILSVTGKLPFGKSAENRHITETAVIVEKIEHLGKLELVKYNFRELFEYKRLSDGKIIGNAILKTNSYSPDLSVVLVASGEAVGCIDLTKIKPEDINIGKDTVHLLLPAPELCYHKLDMNETKLYSVQKNSWWSRLFTDEEEKNQVLHAAYQKAELRLKEAAVASGIYQSVNENAKSMLKPILEQMTGKTIMIDISLPSPALKDD